MGRAVAAGAAFVAAAGSGLVTALAVADPSAGLWVALGVLVVLGAVLQGAVTAAECRSPRRVLASGAGAVAVGGSAGEVHTYVEGPSPLPTTAEAGEITASGPGAVSIGGEANGPITTELPGGEGVARS